MTWLDEIEDKNRQYRSEHKFEISPYEELPTEVMARVIREQAKVIKIASSPEYEDGQWNFLIAIDNLPPEAKVLLK